MLVTCLTDKVMLKAWLLLGKNTPNTLTKPNHFEHRTESFQFHLEALCK
ncbi:hypothetical protein JCM19239_6530 [Vibrio variabilis]|uniref:Uncharacterized protein n=1 Tax=Vibrio variabilis TaxID=990271 RepID=A0ABQ0JNM0_9VIBR|nr:hypothetical protein JCM19239_6530 [Vibrio variabilis]